MKFYLLYRSNICLVLFVRDIYLFIYISLTIEIYLSYLDIITIGIIQMIKLITFLGMFEYCKE